MCHIRGPKQNYQLFFGEYQKGTPNGSRLKSISRLTAWDLKVWSLRIIVRAIQKVAPTVVVNASYTRYMALRFLTFSRVEGAK